MEYFPEDTDEAKQEFDQFIKEEWPYDGKPQLDDTKQIAVAQRHNMSTQDRIDNIEEYRNVWAEYLDTIVYDASLNSYIDIHCPDNNT